MSRFFVYSVCCRRVDDLETVTADCQISRARLTFPTMTSWQGKYLEKLAYGTIFDQFLGFSYSETSMKLVS